MKAWLALLLLALLPPVWPAAARGADSPQAAALRGRATLLSQQKRYNEAAGLFARAAALQPQDLNLQRDLMWSLWYAGRYQETLDATSRVMRQAPNDLEALNVMGQAQVALGEADAALATYQRSLRIDPEQISVKKVLASLYTQSGDYKSAEAAYRRLVAMEPREPAWRSALGHIYFNQHRFTEAEAEMDKAVALDPDNLEYKMKRAQALYFGGRKEDGINALWKLASAKPTYWPAVLYAVDMSSVTHRRAEGAALLAGKLDEVAPTDEPKLQQLVLLYRELGMDREYLSACRRLLKLNANNPPLLDSMAMYYIEHGDMKEAARLAQAAIDLDPNFVSARGDLADALEISSQPAKALAAFEEKLAWDPTDPALTIEHARLLYAVGRRKESRRILLRFLAEHERVFLPTLLYHGLTPFTDDPMLAAPIHLTVGRFEEHIRALRDAGYVPITAAQAADWLEGESTLPAKAVLVTFDDARLDSIRYGDPVLRKYGFKATMFSPVYNVANSYSYYANWKLLKEKARSGVWEIQAHGDRGHNLITVDASSRTGYFLVNKIWRDEGRGLETDAEFRARIREDHESAKRKLREHLGAAPRVFAFPEGDFGQLTATNFPAAAPENLRLCRQSYELCFTQNRFGITLRGRDLSRAFRVEPRQDWTADHLVNLFADENPFTLAYRALLSRDTWERKTRDAFYWLAQERNAGASQRVLTADEARIRFAGGELSRGLALAQQAAALDDRPEARDLLNTMRLQMRPRWTPGIQYFTDSRTRRNLRFDQSVGDWITGDNGWSLSQFYGTYKESGVNTITDLGGAADYTRTLGLFQRLALRLEGHHYSAGVQDGIGGQADWRSEWTATFNTDLQGLYRPYDTAAALKANVWERRVRAQGELGSDDSWKGTLQIQFASLTDKNQRYTDLFSLTHPIRDDSDFFWIGQVLYDEMSFVSPNYYSPQNLQQYQAGLGYRGQVTPEIKVEATYLPGYGRETNARAEFIQDLHVSLEKKWGESFSLKPGYSMTKTPTYRSSAVSLWLSYRF